MWVATFLFHGTILCAFIISVLCKLFTPPSFRNVRNLPLKVEGAAMQEWQVWQIREMMMMYSNLEEFKDRLLHPKNALPPLQPYFASS
jgi:hypothetical protein